jgi:pimeloyl-ACP methyl ester carboxylesterase
MRTRILGFAVVVALFSVPTIPGLAVPVDGPGTSSPPVGTDPDQARLVDRVHVPPAVWRPCPPVQEQVVGGAQKSARTRAKSKAPVLDCATVKAPLDYDLPDGPTVKVAILRRRANIPARRIGVLTVVTRQTGTPGTDAVRDSDQWLGKDLLDRFDIVGMDPRGVGMSTRLKCFPDGTARDEVLGMVDSEIPYTSEQENAFVRRAEAWGAACSTTGRTLASSMSTVQVARDLELVRRALREQKLNYLGFSYGTFLGQVYANLFPERFRTMALSGVIDPVGWVGTSDTADRPTQVRIGAHRMGRTALMELFRRCEAAGDERCYFWGEDEAPVAAEKLLQRVRKTPVSITYPTGSHWVLTFDVLVTEALRFLAIPDPNELENFVSYWSSFLEYEDTPASLPGASVSPRAATTSAWGNSPEDGSGDAGLAVLCTDGVHARSAASWPGIAAAVEREVPDLSLPASWASAPCALDTWTARDEDRYTGPFNRRTVSPVLLVANTWDPLTPYDHAVAVSRMLPNSRLLTSDGWGHASYDDDSCVSQAMDKYLVTGALPPQGTTCHSPQPFEETASGGPGTG